MLRTLEEAAAWIDRVGLALIYPNGDYVLPSLWEAVAGDTDIHWAVRDDEGKFVSFTPEMERVWRWKDELPARKLACVGLHLARTSAAVAPPLVAPLYALTGRRGTPDDFRDGELEGLARELAEAALELGRPATRRELRLLVGADKRLGDRAINALQRSLVLTNAGLDTTESGWGSVLHDLFARRWRARLRRLPPREEALRALGRAVLAGADDVSAADLAAALRIRRKEAAATLAALVEDGLAEGRDDEGLTLWNAAAVSPARASARAGAGRAPSARSRAAGSRSSPRRSP